MEETRSLKATPNREKNRTNQMLNLKKNRNFKLRKRRNLDTNVEIKLSAGVTLQDLIRDLPRLQDDNFNTYLHKLIEILIYDRGFPAEKYFDKLFDVETLERMVKLLSISGDLKITKLVARCLSNISSHSDDNVWIPRLIQAGIIAPLIEHLNAKTDETICSNMWAIVINAGCESRTTGKSRDLFIANGIMEIIYNYISTDSMLFDVCYTIQTIIKPNNCGPFLEHLIRIFKTYPKTEPFMELIVDAFAAMQMFPVYRTLMASEVGFYVYIMDITRELSINMPNSKLYHSCVSYIELICNCDDLQLQMLHQNIIEFSITQLNHKNINIVVLFSKILEIMVQNPEAFDRFLLPDNLDVLLMKSYTIQISRFITSITFIFCELFVIAFQQNFKTAIVYMLEKGVFKRIIRKLKIDNTRLRSRIVDVIEMCCDYDIAITQMDETGIIDDIEEMCLDRRYTYISNTLSRIMDKCDRKLNIEMELDLDDDNVMFSF
mgnify:CR=1 FL=1